MLKKTKYWKQHLKKTMLEIVELREMLALANKQYKA
jgi:hypothetical protein